MQASLLDQGLELMLFGMGTVFVFLACLVVATTLMSFLLRHFGAAQAETLPTPAAPQDDKKLIAAITAAIHQYRSRHK